MPSPVVLFNPRLCGKGLKPPPHKICLASNHYDQTKLEAFSFGKKRHLGI